jgi:uncharacterized protein (TIGR01777 family)
MRVVITGGSGLIGRALTKSLAADGHDVFILSRRPTEVSSLPAGANAVRWDGRSTVGWGHLADGAEAIVNLAGESLAQGRWTYPRKRRFRESRLAAGRAVVRAVREASLKPRVVIQASGVGYYGPGDAKVITEETGPGNDFLARLCLEWESSTAAVEKLGVRRAVIRTGLVLSPLGGAFPQMVRPFKLFAGGRLGHGRQWYPWIHIDDEIAAIRFLIDQAAASGPFNLTAPKPVTNLEFSDVMGQVLHRPARLRTPGAALRTAFGEMANLLLEGQRAVPHRLEQLGFRFRFPTVESALQDLTKIRFVHRFQVQAPLAEVADFHARSSSMAKITPPPAIVRIHEAPPRLNEGSEMDFTVWLGPFPLRWAARIEDVTSTGFVDRQVRGPFRQWVHRHSFETIDDATTAVIDEIDFNLQTSLFKRLVGLDMRLMLPLLFAYRKWKTKQLLERGKPEK